MHRLLLLPALLLGVGCSDLQVDLEPAESTELASLLGNAPSFTVGITVAPDTGERYILDSIYGLYRVDGDSAELVLPAAEFPVADVPATSGWTDIVALGDDRFALTAVNDGYVLDLRGRTLMQHFCYVPGWEEFEPTEQQLTHSLGFDPETNRIFAQPQTQVISMEGADPLGASVGVYDAAVGGDSPDPWYDFTQNDFLATGMAVESSESLLLVDEDGVLSRYRLGDGVPMRVGLLQEADNTTGATLDGDRLLVLASGHLLEYAVR